MSPEAMATRYPKTLRIDPLLGLTKRCSKCGEWWTASKAFFGSAPNSNELGLHSHCHACTAERGRGRRIARKEHAA